MPTGRLPLSASHIRKSRERFRTPLLPSSPSPFRCLALHHITTFLLQSPSASIEIGLPPLPLPVFGLRPLKVSPGPDQQANDPPSILTDPDSALSLATKWLTAASPHSTSFCRLSPYLLPLLFSIQLLLLPTDPRTFDTTFIRIFARTPPFPAPCRPMRGL